MQRAQPEEPLEQQVAADGGEAGERHRRHHVGDERDAPVDQVAPEPVAHEGADERDEHFDRPAPEQEGEGGAGGSGGDPRLEGGVVTPHGADLVEGGVGLREGQVVALAELAHEPAQAVEPVGVHARRGQGVGGARALGAAGAGVADRRQAGVDRTGEGELARDRVHRLDDPPGARPHREHRDADPADEARLVVEGGLRDEHRRLPAAVPFWGHAVADARVVAGVAGAGTRAGRVTWGPRPGAGAPCRPRLGPSPLGVAHGVPLPSPSLRLSYEHAGRRRPARAVLGIHLARAGRNRPPRMSMRRPPREGVTRGAADP